MEPGEKIFVLGENGTGKSSLMQYFAKQNEGRCRKIAAHRQTFMNADTLDMTPADKSIVERNIQREDLNVESQYRDPYAPKRPSMTLYELIEAENRRSRSIAKEVDAGNRNVFKQAEEAVAPITVINDLLRQSNIPITITIGKNQTIMASKDGGTVRHNFPTANATPY